jgi:hypothetical protein
MHISPTITSLVINGGRTVAQGRPDLIIHGGMTVGKPATFSSNVTVAGSIALTGDVVMTGNIIGGVIMDAYASPTYPAAGDSKGVWYGLNTQVGA